MRLSACALSNIAHYRCSLLLGALNVHKIRLSSEIAPTQENRLNCTLYVLASVELV